MKNKDKYNLTKLRFVKKKVYTDDSYKLFYATYVYQDKRMIDKFDGSSMADIMVWLERETNE